MTISDFIQKYREAFGDAVPLPVAFGYSCEAATEVRKIPRCMVGAIRGVCEKGALTLSAENVLCGGGRLYTAFDRMPEQVPRFVSAMEHYKQSEELARAYIDHLGIVLSEQPYLNFLRVDRLESWEGMEGLLFFATPDMLSGLCAWAFYDNNEENAVSVPFASGCCGIVTLATQENRRGGRSCFIGLLDPSARLLIPKEELTFTIPMGRLREMLSTLDDSALYQKAFSLVRKRITGELGKGK